MMTTTTTATTMTKKQEQANGSRRHGSAQDARQHHHHNHHHHHHHHQPHRDHHDDEEEEEEEEEDEEAESEEEVGEKDCFFEPLDRIPSSVSFLVDLPSDSDEDEDDDVRFSFASAIAPPTDLRCVTFSREEFLVEHNDNPDLGGYDYDVWMAEPTSIKERRSRLLQGMGFASSKDLAAALRNRSSNLKAVSTAPAASGEHTLESGLPPPYPAPSQNQLAIVKCRSDNELVTTRGAPPSAEPALPRAASAPPTLWGHSAQQKTGAGGGAAGVKEAKEGGSLVSANGGVCRVKNLDTGREFVVSELGKDGTWRRLNDVQTGSQMSMEEFEQFLGNSPIVKELMRRANLRGSGREPQSNDQPVPSLDGSKSSKSGYRKKRGWLKNIKFVASSVTGLKTEKEKGDAGWRAAGKSSADSSSELMKVRQHGKSYKELTGLYMTQEIHAHQGSIWSIKFSWDGRHLASAGEDRVVRVWQVQECDILSSPLRRQEARSSRLSMADGSPERSPLLGTQPSKSTKKSKSRKRSVPDYIVMPEVIFSLSEKPVCSLEGHLDDILDLSWSKSQHLLSSSMDKTVRLWDIESKQCLKLFAHNDYVTCIQFNPIDDRYFISGSLDSKVRIWSVPERQVVDWNDLHEMVTAACYTPDGQGALVGSHKGSCRFYKTSDCKLSQQGQMDIRIKKKKSHAKKITGFQFAPGNPSQVLITSADSRVRIFDGPNMVHKFRGFRNTSSQISASYASEGKYVVSASEDSYVYVWKREAGRVVGAAGKGKSWTTTRSHEYFYCKDVSVAIPWPSAGSQCSPLSLPSPTSGRFDRRPPQQEPLGCTDSRRSTASLEDIFHSGRRPAAALSKKSFSERGPSSHREEFRSVSRWGIGSDSFASGGAASSVVSDPGTLSSSFSSWGWYSGGSTRTSSTDPPNAWGLVVVTAGLGGHIRIYQNFGLPLRLGRQTNLF
ncbi:uncharacterized protein LOC135678298 [Musa acuminata AAA Group]|uniref:uncharacterized protein LOC135678298 n=1 Tax=Musa acuminata AAA Group TaxID=214697 RepID=UPI0031D4877B